MSLREEIEQTIRINTILDAAIDAQTDKLNGICEAQGNKRDKMAMIVAGNEMLMVLRALKEGLGD